VQHLEPAFQGFIEQRRLGGSRAVGVDLVENRPGSLVEAFRPRPGLLTPYVAFSPV
jgi:hypothetical protein